MSYSKPRNNLNFHCAHDHRDLPNCKQTVHLLVTDMFCIRPSVKDGMTRVRYDGTRLRWN